MDNSKYADLFEDIFGFRPKKSGASYELLVSAAIKAVLPKLKVQANQYVQGTFSGEKYQLDALIESLEKVAVEAKDYSQDKQKVGRPDVSKLAGSLNDLPIDRGIVASPTDFTRHARKYAEGTKLNPQAKPIDLYHIRESTVEDEQGRITKIDIQLLIERADFQNAKWEPVFTKEGADLLRQTFPAGTRIQDKIEAFYRLDGSIITTIHDLSRNISQQKAIDGFVKDEWVSPEAAYIRLRGSLFPISSYKYEIRFHTSEHRIEIRAEGKAVLLVKSEDGLIDKLVTDADLKKIKFNDDGYVE